MTPYKAKENNLRAWLIRASGKHSVHLFGAGAHPLRSVQRSGHDVSRQHWADATCHSFLQQLQLLCLPTRLPIALHQLFLNHTVNVCFYPWLFLTCISSLISFFMWPRGREAVVPKQTVRDVSRGQEVRRAEGSVTPRRSAPGAVFCRCRCSPVELPTSMALEPAAEQGGVEGQPKPFHLITNCSHSAEHATSGPCTVVLLL